MIKKIAIGISLAVLLIVVILYGYFEINNELSGELSIDQIKTNFINALNNISTYKSKTTGKVIFTDFNGTEISVTERLSNFNISVDISNQSLEQDGEFLIVGEDEKEKMLVYILDDFRYVGSGKEGNLSWMYEELSPNSFKPIWNTYSSLDLFAEQITYENPEQDFEMTWKRLKDESFDNQTFYVLKSEHIINNSNPTSPDINLYEVYHTYWIDKTNYILYKGKINQIRDISGLYAGDFDRRYLDSEDIFIFYDYNIPVNIELSPEFIP